MPTIMCTRRLWEAIGGGGARPRRSRAEPLPSLLGAWSAGDVPTRAGHLVVAIEESTYLTAVCPLVRLPAFVRVFAASVGAALEDLGISADAAERAVMAIVEGVTFARNDNRSLLGSAIDVAWHASIRLERARPGDLSALRAFSASSTTCRTLIGSPLFHLKRFAFWFTRIRRCTDRAILYA